MRDSTTPWVGDPPHPTHSTQPNPPDPLPSTHHPLPATLTHTPNPHPGFAYQNTGKPGVALDMYRKAVAIQPGCVYPPPTRRYPGDRWVGSGCRNAAATPRCDGRCAVVIVLVPPPPLSNPVSRPVSRTKRYVIAWKNIGDVLEADKKFSEALEAYERAAAVAPDDSTARERIAFLRTRIGRFGA